MARKRATLTDLLNDLTYKVIFEKYKLICMNLFKWDGLPDGIEERHIERHLFDYGQALFFKDKKMGHMVLQGEKGRYANVYGDPLTYRAIGFNYNMEYDADDCVLIENNKLRLATRDFIYFYANKITEAERTMDVNVKANKTPVIFAVDGHDVYSFKALFQKVDGNVPAIFADKNLNVDAIGVFDTKAKFLCNDLMDYKKAVENELLTFLGIDNVPVDKKERLVTSEADSNNQLIASFFDLQLEARERACEAINKMYGLSVSVEKRQNNQQIVDNSADNLGEGDTE